MNTLQTLRIARAQLAIGWCEGTRAMLPNGRSTAGNDPCAVRWCALGAIDKAVDGRFYPEGVIQSLDAEIPQAWRDENARQIWFNEPDCRIAQYSNQSGQKAILNLFDRAIAKLEPPARNWARDYMVSLPKLLTHERHLA